MDSEESKGTRWCISVDGSDICWESFHTVFDNLKKENDYMIVSHVYDDKKDFLDYKFKPDNIKQDFEAQLIGTHSSKWVLVWQHKDNTMTTKEHMVAIAEEYKSDVLVLGFHGRKGLKDDPTLLGSNVDKIALDPVCPILVMKRKEERKDKENGAFRYLVCMDDREKSIEALTHTIKIMDTEKDELIAIHVKSATMNSEKIEESAAKVCEEGGVKNFSFELHQKEFIENVGDAISDYINIDDTPYIDFVAIPNRGVSHHLISPKDKHLGKVAKQVLLKSKANVLLIA
jgi:hypothetical protein